ncbi:hypothetical protein [Fontibacter flavus]|uniref:Uncharacterized protein n=1 Tax=Fontibacter flavus TaxID=654838 RepID=A0ABV6FTS4_9BACT
MKKENIIIELIFQDLRYFQVLQTTGRTTYLDFSRYGMLELILKVWEKDQELDVYDVAKTYMEYIRSVKYEPFAYFGDHLKPIALNCYEALVKRIKFLDDNPEFKYCSEADITRYSK